MVTHNQSLLKRVVGVCLIVATQVSGSLSVREFCDDQTKKQTGLVFATLPLRKQIDWQNPDKAIPVDHCFKTTALAEASSRHDEQLVKDLLLAKADPNLSVDSSAPLVCAVTYCDNDVVCGIVQRLLVAGANRIAPK